MLVLTTALVGCSSGNTNQAENNQGKVNQGVVTNEGTEIIIEEDTPDNKVVSNEEGVIGGKYKVKFGTAEKVTSDYVDADVLLVHYTFTNNSDETVSADLALMIDAYQDGIQVEQVFDVSLTGDNAAKNLKPGSSLECSILFELTSTSDLEVEATEFLGMDGSMVTKTYSIQ